jgi:hypothetical protein
MLALPVLAQHLAMPGLLAPLVRQTQGRALLAQPALPMPGPAFWGLAVPLQPVPLRARMSWVLPRRAQPALEVPWARQAQRAAAWPQWLRVQAVRLVP